MLNDGWRHRLFLSSGARGRRLFLVAVFFLVGGLWLTFGGWSPGAVVSGQGTPRRQLKEVRQRLRESIRRRMERLERLAGAEGRRQAGAGGALDSPAEVGLVGGVGGGDGRSLSDGAWSRARRRYDQPREAIEFFLFKRLAEGDLDLSFDRYLAARREADRLPRYSSRLGREFAPAEAAELMQLAPGEPLGEWIPLGPGNIGGRTRALLINPQNPAVMYAAGVSGGVWRSVDSGGSWTPLTDLLPGLTVSSMAFEPGNPLVIYIGTGEGVAAFQRDTQGDFRGAGIFRTTDGGESWSRLEATAGTDFYFVNDLVVSPKDPRRIYAATRTGIWRSLDGGGTWSRTLNPLNGNGQTVLGGCFDLALRTDQPADSLLATCGTFEQATIYRQLDGAGSGEWAAVLTETDMGRTALAISPSDQNIVYAVATSIAPGPFDSALHAVFRSTSGGEAGSWVAQVRNTSENDLNRSILSIPNLALAVECGFGGTNDFFGQGWYDLSIAVDPLDPQRVWVGGIDIFRSDDGGVNWGVAGPSYVGANFAAGPIHPDHHVIIFHPQYDGGGNRQLFVGNDGGVYRTLDARGAVATTPAAACRADGVGIRWEPLNRNYGVTQFYHGSVSPDGRQYYGGTQDNGTILGTDTGGINQWREIYGGDGGYTAFDFTDPLTLFASFTYISLAKSTDGGQTFGEATRGISDRGLFIAPYAMDPSDPRRLWTGGDYIWRTTNGASNWERASAITPGTLQVSAIAVSPIDANRVLVGMADGFILRQTAALQAGSGTSWLNTRPRSGYLSSLTFDPVVPDVAYATYSSFGGRHVWRTIDGGISWTAIDGAGGGTGSGSLPDIPVHSLVVDPVNQARLYVGTDLGVFVTSNGGTTWAVEYSGFANVITESLQLNIRDGSTWLYAFTHGRGVWRVRINDSGCQFSLSPATVTVGGGGRDGQIEVVPAPGTPAGCRWEAAVPAASAGWLTLNGTGSGAGQARWSVGENTSTVTRIGTATIAGRSLTVIQPGRKDTESPVVVIAGSSTPAGATNSSGILELWGTVSDNDGVAEIRWASDRGGSGLATLDSTGAAWRVGAIPLGPGQNQITVTAVDRSGNRGLTMWGVRAEPAAVLMTFAGTGENGRSGDGGPATAARLSRPTRLAFDRSGNLYFADSDNNQVRRVTPDGVISTIAGNGDPAFRGDGGLARQASLNFPIGVAVDTAGDLYICDNGNARIRKVVIASGIITTVAGNGLSVNGADGGLALDTPLNNAQAIDLDAAGNLYIAELGAHRIRRVTISDGKIETLAGTGTAGFDGDGGPAKGALLSSPNHVFVDRAGNLLITDAGNNRIRLLTMADGSIRTVAGNGQRGFTGDGGVATMAALATPSSAIADELGDIYIADRGNHRVRRVAAATGIMTTVAGNGEIGYGGEGFAAPSTPLNFPTGLALDPAGGLYLADRENRRLRRVVVAADDTVPPVVTITSPLTPTPPTLPTLTVTSGNLRLVGTAADNRQLVTIRWFNDRGGMGMATGLENWRVDQLTLQPGLNRIRVTAWDARGNSASANLTVTLEVAATIRTLAGDGQRGDQGDGEPGTAARLYEPGAMTIDRAGNLYLADSGNNRIRRIAPNGLITAYAGNGIIGARGDGGPALEASLNGPNGLALDSKGNLYIADTYNHRIRRVTPAGIITTVAGNGLDGGLGDDGPATAASLYLPFGVTVDSADNLIIADTGNLRLRRVDAVSGTITTIAGNGRYGADGDGGPAREASFKAPYGVTIDSLGAIYVVDGDDHRVRRIDQGGTISAYAGTGVRGSGGDGQLAVEAQLNFPSFISTDRDGNLYIADFGNHRVRRVAVADGRISTVIGTGVAGAGMDGVDPLSTTLAYPNDVAVDPQGRLVVVDSANHRVRQVISATSFQPAVMTSAASYNGQEVARDSLVAIFGQGLATTAVAATELPLPTQLGGTTVLVRDAAGVERAAGLIYVSPQQINLQLPASMAPGTASLTITSGDGRLASGLIPVTNTAPAIFSAGATGRGVAAAYLLRVKADGRQLVEPVASYDSSTATWVPLPIDFGEEGDQLFLVLFGTGWRFARPAEAEVLIGGRRGEVAYLGPQGGFVGLDQLNLRLDRQLSGRGLVDIQLQVDGLVSNLVQVLIR